MIYGRWQKAAYHHPLSARSCNLICKYANIASHWPNAGFTPYQQNYWADIGRLQTFCNCTTHIVYKNYSSAVCT